MLFKKGHTINLGRHCSKETRKKLSEANKGNIVWNKGKHLSEKTKRKISEARKGKHHSEETKEKIGKANKGGNHPNYGRHLPIEIRRKISKALKGIKCSEETKEKIRKSKIGTRASEITKRKLSEAHKGLNTWIKGKHHTEETKLKISEANKGRKLTKEHIKKCLTRRIPSSLEEKFQGIIDKYNLPYKYVGNGSFIIENCNPDFINTNNEKIAIEVYARYYKLRNNISIEKWKKERAKVFREYGWEIIYFDETEVNEEYVLETLKGGL